MLKARAVSIEKRTAKRAEDDSGGGGGGGNTQRERERERERERKGEIGTEDALKGKSGRRK
jgi:hypothetical protein